MASNFFLFSLLSIHQYAKMSLSMNCKTVHCSHSKLAYFSSPSLFLQLFRNAVIFMMTYFHFHHDAPPVPPAVYYPASVDGNWSPVSGKVMQINLQQYKIDENYWEVFSSLYTLMFNFKAGVAEFPWCVLIGNVGVPPLQNNLRG